MDQHSSRSSDLPQPLRAVAAGLRQLPGAEQLGKAAGGALDAIGAVSPRTRRMAVYVGAGVLGAAGIVEWPVALTGAAVAWLTQPRPGERPETQAQDGGTPAQAGTEGTAARTASRSGQPTGPGDRLAAARPRHEPDAPHVHEQPAKVGDTATASALKQVAEATAHHRAHAAHPPHGNGEHRRTGDGRSTG